MQELVLRLVWDAGDPRDFGGEPIGGLMGRLMDGRRFVPRSYMSLVRNVEVFSR